MHISSSDFPHLTWFMYHADLVTVWIFGASKGSMNRSYIHCCSSIVNKWIKTEHRDHLEGGNWTGCYIAISTFDWLTISTVTGPDQFCSWTLKHKHKILIVKLLPTFPSSSISVQMKNALVPFDIACTSSIFFCSDQLDPTTLAPIFSRTSMKTFVFSHLTLIKWEPSSSQLSALLLMHSLSTSTGRVSIISQNWFQ